jgi:hypothetical protein
MYVNNAVVIGKPGEALIRGDKGEADTIVKMQGLDIILHQDEECILLDRGEAEALFLVLDTMLHPDEVGVDPDFDDYDGYEIPALRYGTTRSFDPS